MSALLIFALFVIFTFIFRALHCPRLFQSINDLMVVRLKIVHKGDLEPGERSLPDVWHGCFVFFWLFSFLPFWIAWTSLQPVGACSLSVHPTAMLRSDLYTAQHIQAFYI